MADLYVMGTVISDHDSAVCLLRNGKLVAAIGEERLCRIKRGDPRNSIRRAINYVLAEAGIDFDRVDWILCDCDHYYPPDHPPIDVFPDFPRKDRVVQINHHVGHVTSAFLPSPFDEAAVLTVDASGGIAPIVPDKRHWGLIRHEIDFRGKGFFVAHKNPTLEELLAAKPGGEARNYPAESLSLCRCVRGEPFVELENYFASASLGYFYAIVAHFLDMEEGSFMGLSSHGRQTEYYDAACEMLRLLPEGRIEINVDWMKYWEGAHVLDDPVNTKRLTAKFFETFGRARHHTDKITDRDKNFAWAMQKRLEDAMVHVATHLHELTGSKNLCIAGGVGLNSVANLVVLQNTPFEHIFVQPAASDDGIALGNALFGHYVLNDFPRDRFFDMGDAGTGRRYAENEIEGFFEGLDQGRLKIDYLPSLPFVHSVDVLVRTAPEAEPQRIPMAYNHARKRFEIEIDVHSTDAIEYEFDVTADSPSDYVYRPPQDAPVTDAGFSSCEIRIEEKPSEENQDPFARFLNDHRDIAGVLEGQQAFVGPEHVVIDPTNRCDNNCIGCWTRSPLLGSAAATDDWKRQELDPDRLLTMIDELAEMGTKRIRFTGGGEPFLHPAIMEALRKTKEHGLIAAVTSNFSAIREPQVRTLAELGVDEITVSLWAGSPEVYARSHPNKSAKTFERIESHLRLLSSLKPKSSKLILANVIFSMNFMETREMLDFALRVGADGIYFTVIDSVHDRTDGLLLTPPHIGVLEDHLLQVKDKVDGLPAQGREFLLDNFDGFLRRIRSIGAVKGNYDKIAVDEVPCAIGWIFCRILPDGDVSPCCRGVDLPMGNINEQSFAEIWHGKKYREFRQMALTQKKSHKYFAPVACHRTCDNLMHNLELKRRIDKLTDQEKQHLLKFVAGKP